MKKLSKALLILIVAAAFCFGACGRDRGVPAFENAAQSGGSGDKSENGDGETSAKFEEKSFVSGVIKMNYCLYTPKNEAENLPLIVYLHGGSGKGSDLSLLYSVDGLPQYLKDGKLSPQAYVLMPQLANNKKGWTDVSAALKTLIQSVSAELKTNAEKISLTGHSMGGTGTWGVAAAVPELFYRIAPLSGSIDITEANVSALKNLPVRAFVGSEDTIVPPESSQNMIAALKEVGNDAEITVFQGASHFDVPELTYFSRTFDLLSWLAE